ncbi:MAG: DUF4129 domain-containing protein [Acidimicrobiales bacterium]
MADAGDIKNAAEDIVSQPQYRAPERGVVQRAIDWIGDRLQPVGDAISDFLEWLARRFGISAGGAGGVGSGGYLLGWILLAVGAALVIWFLLRVMPRRRLRGPKKEKPTIEQRSRHRTTRREWLDRAAVAESERDFNGAVRARYRALIAGLADADELDDDEALTSGEHLRSFETVPPRREQFASATETYERAWFGEQPVGLDDSHDLEGIDRDLIDGGRRS